MGTVISKIICNLRTNIILALVVILVTLSSCSPDFSKASICKSEKVYIRYRNDQQYFLSASGRSAIKGLFINNDSKLQELYAMYASDLRLEQSIIHSGRHRGEFVAAERNITNVENQVDSYLKKLCPTQ